jgi:hypothetical protein
MAWHQGPRESDKLKNLASIVARLVRVTLYKNMAAGDALLKAQGSPLELGPAYKKHAISARSVLVSKKSNARTDLLSVKESGDWK